MGKKLTKLDQISYSSWRRREAYGIPMTEEGSRKAEERWKAYDPAFQDGFRKAIAYLEMLHSKHKKDHMFYYRASQEMKAIANEEMETDKYS